MVDTDSLELARRNASRAVTSSTPSISNSTLPGSTSATQYSTLPLPAPMRTSRGFFEIGTSGNTRIQIWPPRFTARAMARRAASISRAVMRARLVAFNPNSPKATELPRTANPQLRPLNCLRYLVRLGCSMDRYSGRGFGGGSGGRGGALTRLARGDRLVDRRLLEHFTLEDPHLDADDAVSGAGLGKAVVDVGAERVQRDAALAVPLRA